MSTRYARILLAGPAAVLAAALGVTSALAATTWTVKPGGKVTAKSGAVRLRDTKSGAVVNCASSTVKITLKSGSGLPGAGIGSITSFTFGTCTGPLGTTFTLTNSHLPYSLNAVSYDSSTGTTKATITGIHGVINGPSCTWTVDGTGATKDNGTIAVTYVNSTHKLKYLATGGNLHIYRVIGCAGLITNGDPATGSGTATVTPAQTITNP
jgi:hypothetical protein